MSRWLGKPALLALAVACGKGGDRDRAPAPAPIPADAAVSAPDEVTALVERGIRKADDGYEVDRELIRAVWAEPARFTGGARLVPDQARGLRVEGVWPRSVYARLGLANGDLLESIDGQQVVDGDRAALYEHVIAAELIVLRLTRAGAPRVISYRITGAPATAAAVPAPAVPALPTPHPTPHAPAPADPVADRFDAAARAFDRGDYEEAIVQARFVLAKQPGHVRALRIVVTGYCAQSEMASAKAYFRRLPAHDQEQMRRRCARYGIDL